MPKKPKCLPTIGFEYSTGYGEVITLHRVFYIMHLVGYVSDVGDVGGWTRCIYHQCSQPGVPFDDEPDLWDEVSWSNDECTKDEAVEMAKFWVNDYMEHQQTREGFKPIRAIKFIKLS